jgi:ABC-type polysaccharide/polyol phosphate transport system ATPase subunit
MKPILEIQNLSKRFFIGRERMPYYSFRDRLSLLFKTQSLSEEFWALKDVSFSVMPGDTIGVIGRNGAGKSTLLKILSRITPPTSGRIVSRGRIASLLEVGTGFHQELTGRENIFMNGSILGMKNSEIKKRFDEIVDFSGVEQFLDTALKHFSSGMQLRLAFAVAAFLENEILIIDEVLAVGDAEFQKKCFGKMGEVANDGRTVLFVSHNLPSLKTLCKKGILLEKGKLSHEDTIAEVISHYTSHHQGTRKILEGVRYFRKEEKINSIQINGSELNTLVVNDFKIQLVVDITFPKRTAFELQAHLKKDDAFVCSYANFVKGDTCVFEEGRYLLTYEIQFPELRSGKYNLDLYFTVPFVSWFANTENDIEIEFVNDRHQVFLNTPAFNWWGSVIAEGTTSQQLISK